MATLTGKRSRPKSYSVLAATGSKVIDRTTLEGAREYEQRGIWRREYDTQTGELRGFRVDGADVTRVDLDLPHMQTTVAISRTEMEVNAFGMRSSHTFRMTEPERLQQAKNGLPPEDMVERTIAKIRVYKLVGAARGDILKAWPRR